MEKLLHTKRGVADLFDARQRQVIRVALVRRRATLERVANTLSKEGIASPDLIEQLVVIRGAEHEEEERAFPDHADMGVLAAFKEITEEELKLEAQRHQGTLFDTYSSSDVMVDGDRAPEAESPSDDEADADGEWVPWSCGVCNTVRKFPRRNLPDNSASFCPKGCGATMRPPASETAELTEAQEPESEPEQDALPKADEALRAQRLEDRPEFRGRRAINALQEAHIYTVGELLDRANSPISIGRIRGLGTTGEAQVQAVLEAIRRELTPSANGTATVPADAETADIAPEHPDGLPF